MRIKIVWSSYNGRRYGRPWIAKVTAWPVGVKPELAWGGYTGSESGGLLEIDAAPGDVVRWGQKDYRGNNDGNRWGLVADDGTIKDLEAKDAREAWVAANGTQDANKTAPASVKHDGRLEIVRSLLSRLLTGPTVQTAEIEHAYKQVQDMIDEGGKA
jgi:hypothetical protein